MKEKKELKINIGGASVILILLVLALSIFAVLSIRASNNEWRLAKKTAEAVKKYYDADREAVEVIKQINEISYQAASDLNPSDFEAVDNAEVSVQSDGAVLVSFRKPVSSTMDLSVEALVRKGASCEILQWQMTSAAEEQEYDMGFEIDNLWDGTIHEENDTEDSEEGRPGSWQDETGME